MAGKVLAEPPFVERIVEALRKRLKGAIVETEHVRARRYRFIVIWKRFDSMDHPERQKLVWDIATREIKNKKDLFDVGMILTLGLKGPACRG